MEPRIYKIYQNYNTRGIFDADGEALGNDKVPYIFKNETIIVDLNLINTDDVADLFTGFAGQTISPSSTIDNNWKHYIAGSLGGDLSGAISAIIMEITTGEYINPTGLIQLKNSSGEVESVDYTAFTLSGTTYTFTVSATLTYSYLTNDVSKVADTPLASASSIDSTDQATGRFLITISADSSKFDEEVGSNQTIQDCGFEMQIRDGSAVLKFVSQFEILCFNVREEQGVIPAPADGNYYTKVESDALYLKAASLGNLTENTSNILTITGGTEATFGNVTILVKTAATGQSGYLTSADWNTFNNKQDDLGFTAEDSSNKVTSISGASTDVEYPSAKLLYDTVAGGGDMVLADVQSVTGLKTYDTSKLAVKGTSTGVTYFASVVSGATSYTLTLPSATDTLVGKATTDTLTNKTLTSPVFNGTITGDAFLDEDDMASDSATKLASQQSIKKYVDDNAGGVLTIEDQAGAAYTYVPADNGKMITMSSASANVATVALNATQALPDFASIIGKQIGTGVTTITAVSGVTMNGVDGGSVAVSNQYDSWVLTQDGIDNWYFDITPAGGSASPLTTKGDVFTYSTVDTRLAVGTNGQVLSADSTETTGLKWIAALANPMTAIGDMIIGDTGGAAIKLVGGTDGYILSMVTGSPTWITAPAGTGDMVLAGVQTVTGLKTFDASKLAVKGSSTGVTAIANANATATDYTLTLPSATDTLVGKATTDTLTNKTLTSPVINVTSDATGDIYYRNAGGLFTRLPKGTDAQVLTLASGIPSWATASSGGGDTGIPVLDDQIETDSGLPIVFKYTDGVDADTKLLLHLDNAGFLDSSAAGRTPTPIGSPTFDASIKKFGTHSAVFNGSQSVTYPDSADFDIGTGNFTIECQVYFSALSGTMMLASKAYQVADIGWHLRINATNGLDFVGYNGSYNSGNGVIRLTQGNITGLTVDTWHQVMIVRNGTAFNLYLNGTSVASGATASSINYASGYSMVIADGEGDKFTGKMDEFRFSVGTARQTGNFTPPTQAYGLPTKEYILANARGEILSSITGESFVYPKTGITNPFTDASNSANITFDVDNYADSVALLSTSSNEPMQLTKFKIPTGTTSLKFRLVSNGSTAWSSETVIWKMQWKNMTDNAAWSSVTSKNIGTDTMPSSGTAPQLYEADVTLATLGLAVGDVVQSVVYVDSTSTFAGDIAFQLCEIEVV